MKFLDLFAGIGGFHLGMEQAGHECVGWVEWDKFARQSYMAVHDGAKDLWNEKDINDVKAEDMPKADVWCFGFPCQDISVAGKQGGFTNGKRSSLFFTVTGLLRELKEEDKPKYLLIENVKNLLSINKGWDFAKLQIELDEIGYDCEWDVLDSAEVVPQHRERIYIVGHLRGASTRKVFPISRKNEQTNKTDESRTVKQIGNIGDTTKYGGNPQIGRVYDASGVSPTINTMQGGGREPKITVLGNTSNSGYRSHDVYSPEGQVTTLMARDFKGPKQVAIPTLTPDRINKRQNGRRFKENGDPEFTVTAQDRHGVLVVDDQGRKNKELKATETVPTLRAQSHGNEPKLLVREATKKGYAVAESGDSINISQPNSKTRRGRVGKQRANTLLTGEEQAVVLPKEEFGRLGRQATETFNKERPEYGDTIDPYNKCVRTDGKTNTVTTRPEGLKTAILPITHNLRIRKLTPLECWRLQGFPDWAFYKAQEDGVSNSQLYKQAGNSVTVPVVRAIAEKL